MISYFRLFAGLTSLMSALCLRHLSASGPAGILDSSLAMAEESGGELHHAGQDGDGDRGIEEKIQPAVSAREALEAARPLFVFQAEGLHEADDPVAEMVREDADREDVEDGHPQVRE